MSNIPLFELGISFSDLSKFSEYSENISSFSIGCSVVSNRRGTFFPLEEVIKMKERYPSFSFWVVANDVCITQENTLSVVSTLVSIYKLVKISGYIVKDAALAFLLMDNGVPVKMSILNDIQTEQQISFLVNKGIQHIYLSPKLNRDIEKIYTICNKFSNTTFYLLVNELCEYGCPYPLYHYRVESPETTVHKYHCDLYDMETVGSIKWNERVLRSTFIPPENISFYPKNIIFKLSTRQYPTDFFTPNHVLSLFKRYLRKEEYSDVLDLFSLNIPELKKAPIEIEKTLFNKWKSCKNICSECNSCRQYLERR